MLNDSLPVKTIANFYKVIVQSILLYGSETWVVTGIMWKKLRTFHHGVARAISNPCLMEYEDHDSTGYASISLILTSIGLEKIEVYVERRRQTLQTTMTHPEYDDSLFQQCTELPVRKTVTWWKQKIE